MRDASDLPSLPPEEHARWWQTVGEDELRQVLYDYVPDVMALLRGGGSVDDVAEYLRRIQIEWMGMEPPQPAALRDAADFIVEWYEGSVGRWAEGFPPA